MLLGVIASYCHGMGISDVRLLQCDTRVTVDHRVSPQELREYKIKGMGGSDMTPALRRLTDDPEVEAVILITDGYIHYPSRVPFAVLWALTPPRTSFRPPYGAVVPLEI